MIFTKILENKAAKITTVVALFTGLQFIVPEIRNFIVGEEITNNNIEVYEYIDKKNEVQDSISFDWELYFVQEFMRVDDRYRRDSLKNTERDRYFAVGLRADRETGALHYRNRQGVLSPVKPDDTLKIYRFRPDGTTVWLPCYYEE